MRLMLLSEAAPSDLMPASDDPYQGSGTGMQEPAEAPAAPAPAPEAPPEPAPLGLADDEGDSLLGADADFDLEIDQEEPMEPSPLEQADWIEQESTDRRDMTFSHKDGFHLRARQLDSNDKWLAQLYAGDKILDKGFVQIPPNEDPGSYMQGLAEKMLKLEKTMPEVSPEMEVGPGEMSPAEMMPTAPEEI